jgi:fumarate hydratase class II
VETVRLRKDQVHSEEDNGFHCQDDGNLDDTVALTSMRSGKALSPVIDYQSAAHVAGKATVDGTSRRDAAVAPGKVNATLFDKTIKPRDMGDRGLASAQNIGDTS